MSAYRLASAIAKISRRSNPSEGARLATVVDPRPSSTAVLVAGYDAPVRAALADWFDLTPLEMQDLVLVLPSPAGWTVVARLTGGFPEIIVDPAQINGSVVLAGAPFTEDGPTDTVQHWWLSDEVTVSAGGTTAVTWDFEQEFLSIPQLIAMPHSDSGVQNIAQVGVGTYGLTRESAAIAIHNASGVSLDVRVRALAHGEV